MKPERDHHATFRKLDALWPAMADESSKMCLNQEQRRQWIDAIEPLNQVWMREAADRAYRAAPSRFPPTIETLMTHFRAVAADQSAAPSRTLTVSTIEETAYLGGYYAADRDAILANLLRWPRDEVLEARDKFVASKWAAVLERETEECNQSDDPNDWSEGRRGYVHGRYELDHPEVMA